MEVLPCQNEYFIIHLTFRCVLSDDYTKTESTAADILPSGTKCDQTDLPVTSKHLRSTQERRTVMIICRRSLLSDPPPFHFFPPSTVLCWALITVRSGAGMSITGPDVRTARNAFVSHFIMSLECVFASVA